MSRPSWQLRDAALGYASRGIPVLPLHYPLPHRNGLQPVPGDPQPAVEKVGCSCRDRGCGQPGKHPLGALVPHGVKDATCNRARILAWWTRHPQANIGLATGHTFDVLDVDGPNGTHAIRTLAAEHGLQSFPATAIAAAIDAGSVRSRTSRSAAGRSAMSASRRPVATTSWSRRLSSLTRARPSPRVAPVTRIRDIRCSPRPGGQAARPLREADIYPGRPARSPDGVLPLTRPWQSLPQVAGLVRHQHRIRVAEMLDHTPDRHARRSRTTAAVLTVVC